MIDTGIRITHSEFDGLSSIARLGRGVRGRLDDTRRLRWPRHACGRHDRRHDVRRRQGCEPRGGARARLHRLGPLVMGHRRDQLGHCAARRGRGGRSEHEPRRRRDSSVDAAVANSIADGVTYAIAAGNSNANACNYSPARTAAALTIGATTSTDARSSFSNYGSCVDWFAPGSSITSARIATGGSRGPGAGRQWRRRTPRAPPRSICRGTQRPRRRRPQLARERADHRGCHRMNSTANHLLTSARPVRRIRSRSRRAATRPGAVRAVGPDLERRRDLGRRLPQQRPDPDRHRQRRLPDGQHRRQGPGHVHVPRLQHRHVHLLEQQHRHVLAAP